MEITCLVICKVNVGLSRKINNKTQCCSLYMATTSAPYVLLGYDFLHILFWHFTKRLSRICVWITLAQVMTHRQLNWTDLNWAGHIMTHRDRSSCPVAGPESVQSTVRCLTRARLTSAVITDPLSLPRSLPEGQGFLLIRYKFSHTGARRGDLNDGG